jgi:hypothetical protein
MNQIFSDQVDKELIILLIMLIGYLICKVDKPKKESSVAITDPAIREAKKWYDSTYRAATDAKLSESNIEKYSSDWNKKFRPDWPEAQIFDENDATIIEIPALKNGEMTLSFSRPDAVNVDFNKSGTTTSLLIVKRKMEFNLYAMTIVASASHLKANDGKPPINNYRKKDKNFEGAVFFNKMDGTFVGGWRYQNGKPTRQLYPLGANCSRIHTGGGGVKADGEFPSGRIPLITVALWEDRIYHKNDPTAYYGNTYIVTNACADCPIDENIIIPGGIHETLTPHTAAYILPSRFRLEQELHQLKVGFRNLN